VALEEQGDVANDEAVTAFVRALYEPGAKSLDLRVNDFIQELELFVIAEDNSAQRATVESTVGRNYRIAPSSNNLCVRCGAELDGSPGEHVGVDDGSASL